MQNVGGETAAKRLIELVQLQTEQQIEHTATHSSNQSIYPHFVNAQAQRQSLVHAGGYAA